MKPRIWNFIPYCHYDKGKKDLAQSYRHYMELIPDKDWAVLMDHDIFITTKQWFRVCESAIERYPNAGMFTCLTSRHLRPHRAKWKVFPGLNNCFDVRRLASIGEALYKKQKNKFKEVTTTEQRNGGNYTTGYFMLIRKAAWSIIEPYVKQHGRGNIDHSIHKEMEKAGLKIYLMEGLLVFHYAKAGRKLANLDNLR